MISSLDSLAGSIATNSSVIHIIIANDGSITPEAHAALTAVINRNLHPDCEKTVPELIADTLTLVAENLQSADVYDASFADQSRIIFYRPSTAPSVDQAFRRMWRKNHTAGA